MRLLFLALLCFSFSTQAFYFSLSSDAVGSLNSTVDDNVSSSFSGNLAFGYNYTKNIRLELNYVYHEMKKENAPIDYVALNTSSLTNISADTTGGFGAGFASFYYDFDVKGRFSPFVGFGLGVGKIEYAMENIKTTGPDISSVKESETNIISKFSIGAKYYFYKSFGSSVQYDYFKSSFIDSSKQYGLMSDSQVNLGIFVEF